MSVVVAPPPSADARARDATRSGVLLLRARQAGAYLGGTLLGAAWILVLLAIL